MLRRLPTRQLSIRNTLPRLATSSYWNRQNLARGLTFVTSFDSAIFLGSVAVFFDDLPVFSHLLPLINGHHVQGQYSTTQYVAGMERAFFLELDDDMVRFCTQALSTHWPHVIMSVDNG